MLITGEDITFFKMVWAGFRFRAMTLLRRSRSVKMPTTSLLSIATRQDMSREAITSATSLTVAELAIVATSEVISFETSFHML